MQELPISREQMETLMKLSRTEPGKKLIAIAKKEKGPQLRSAIMNADYDSAREMIGELMENPQVKALLRELGR